MMLMKILNPVGAESRRRHRLKRRIYQNKVFSPFLISMMIITIDQGPNFVWHLDGYDKLKPYGFSIHGYIDG